MAICLFRKNVPSELRVRSDSISTLQIAFETSWHKGRTPSDNNLFAFGVYCDSRNKFAIECDRITPREPLQTVGS
jgi:hypothetical protein